MNKKNISYLLYMHNTMMHTHQHSAHTPSPDPYFATCIGNATSTFIWEDDIPPGVTADDASFGVALSSVYALADDELNGSSYQTTIFVMLAATNRRRTVSSLFGLLWFPIEFRLIVCRDKVCRPGQGFYLGTQTEVSLPPIKLVSSPHPFKWQWFD
jgi:hypothetical protein